MNITEITAIIVSASSLLGTAILGFLNLKLRNIILTINNSLLSLKTEFNNSLLTFKNENQLEQQKLHIEIDKVRLELANLHLEVTKEMYRMLQERQLIEKVKE